MQQRTLHWHKNELSHEKPSNTLLKKKNLWMSQHETDVFVIKSRCNSFHKETYKVTVLRPIHTELRVQSGISLWFIIVSVNWAKLPWAICLGPTWDPFQAQFIRPTWNPYWDKLGKLSGAHMGPIQGPIDYINMEPILGQIRLPP